MKQEALIQFPMPLLTTIGLVLFFSVFMGVVIWTYRVIEEKKWREIARLAIEDDASETSKGVIP